MRKRPRCFCSFLAGLLLCLVALSPLRAQRIQNQGMTLQPGQWMEIADNALISIPLFTAECWVNFRGGGLVVTRDSPTGTPSDWQVWYEHARKRLAFITSASPPDSYFYTADNVITPGRWHHIAVAVDGPGGSASLYLDGGLVVSARFSPRLFDAATGLAWGGYFRNSAYLNATFDECRYWNHVRTVEQIRAFRNCSLGPDERTGLHGYWMFCGGFADSSGHRNDGVPKFAPSIVTLVDEPTACIRCDALTGTPRITTLPPRFRRRCTDEGLQEAEVRIKNVGYGPLRIDSVHWTGSGAAVFVLRDPVSIPPDRTVLRGDSIVLKVGFAPAAAGTYDAAMLVFSNSATDSIVSVPLHGVLDSVGVVVPPVDFGLVPMSSFPVTTDVMIRNSGTVSWKLTSAAAAPGCAFAVVGGLPLALGPGDSAMIRIRFDAQDGDSVATCLLALVAEPPFCTVVSLALRGARLCDNVIIRAGEAAAPAGSLVRIPLTVNGLRCPTLASAREIRTELRFNASLLSLRSPGIERREGRDRIVELTLPPTIDSNQVLTTLEFLAMLGDAEYTPLRVEHTRFIGAAAAVVEIPGSFTLEGICREGGARLLNDTGRIFLAQNTPNPFNPSTVIEFETIERAQTALLVFDVIGREVARLFDGVLEPGRHQARFDAAQFPSGLYRYVLITPSFIRQRSMLHLK